jgi:hypothetical protein
MDKASILGDAIDYVIELQNRLRTLENKATQDGSLRQTSEANADAMDTTISPVECADLEKRREGFKTGVSMEDFVHGQINVSVSMENDVTLIKLHCPWRQTLLVDVLQALNEFGFEVSGVQSSTENGTLSATLQAKVRSGVDVLRSNITEVKEGVQRAAKGLSSDRASTSSLN